MPTQLPVWRSLMYVPVNVEKYVDKAHTGGADVVVRINRPLSLAVRDLEHSIMPDVNGIALTKMDSASHVKLLDELVSELEEKRGMTVGHTKFITMIETADAFSRIDEIPRAAERVVAMNIGGEDFALDCDMQPDDDVLLHPKQRMIIAARAAGVMPLGFIGTVAGFGDWERFRQMVRRSRRFGFDGAGCIHPGQVTIVNEEYSPSDEEVAYARKIIEMDKAAAKSGRGSFAVDGKMIDIPIIVRAQKLIARHEAIAQREAKTMAAMG